MYLLSPSLKQRKSVPTGPTPREPSQVEGSWLDRWARSAVLSQLASLPLEGCSLVEGAQVHHFGSNDLQSGLQLEVLSPRFYREVALGGSLGAADAFVEGLWRSDDLLRLLRMFSQALNDQQEIHTLRSPSRWLTNQWQRWQDRNNRWGSRRNIRRHYDLSNELFALFLDPTMTYSSGIFETEQATLEEASRAKYERICRRLDLRPCDHVVEIGCGWGGFAEYAATNFGCRVTGITISEQQLNYAHRRIERARLQDRVDLRLCDYRDLNGQFDKLVSIEMIEAVGHEYLPIFFRKCSELLRADGEMMLQAITIPDDRHQRYRKRIDFIQKYIFPGGCLPSLGSIATVSSRASDLRIVHLKDFGADYAKTLMEWRERFFAAADQILDLGFDQRFLRTWDYYFCYCAAGFLQRQIGVAQIHMKRPQAD